MEPITHPVLVKALVKPPVDIIASLSINTADLWHGATGVAGEGGELLEGLVLYVTGNATHAEAVENVTEELGDLYFYIEQLTQRTGITLDWEVSDTFARSQYIGPDSVMEHGALVAVYASQVLDTVKKAAVYNKALDETLLRSQLMNLIKFMLTIGYQFGVSRDTVLEHNIAKLSKRYEGLNYSDAAAQLRADKQIHRKPFPGEPNPVVIPHTSHPPGNPDE